MKHNVAIITLDPKNKKIIDMKLTQNEFRFKCKRCATLCCKLGGPLLTRKDAKMIESAGFHVNDFLESNNQNAEDLPLVSGLKTRTDGSCIFLQFDTEQNYYHCGIYEHRPALCRVYPFSFESLGSNRVALKFIPCCMGLNNPEGKVLDKKYVSNRLLEPLLEAMNLLQKDTLN